MSTLRITQKRSAIGYKHDQRDTLRALGLRRLHHTVEKMDTPTLRGMLHKVRHLVIVEEVGEENHGK
jgi:large subunit ribosomal protein L30